MTDDTVECISVEGQAAQVVDSGRHGQWVGRYLDKYRPVSPGLSPEFLAQNVIVEFVPERALAVIEREEDFSTRATRWVFPR